MAIMMNEFVPVLNIGASSDILLNNNLSYVICVTFFLGRPWACEHMMTAIGSLIWGVVAHIVVK